MRANHRLTDNAILYASLGFQQQCLLQVLSLRPGPHSSLQMVVYDGTAYAGALFYPLVPFQSTQLPRRQNQPFPPTLRVEEDQGRSERAREESVMPSQLDVIRAVLVSVGRSQPLQVSRIQVVGTRLADILGQQILSLEEYMKRRKFIAQISIEQEYIAPQKATKKIKAIILDAMGVQQDDAELAQEQIPSPVDSNDRAGKPIGNVNIRSAQEIGQQGGHSTDEVSESKELSVTFARTSRVIPDQFPEGVQRDIRAQGSTLSKHEPEAQQQEVGIDPKVEQNIIPIIIEQNDRSELKPYSKTAKGSKTIIDLIQDSPQVPQKTGSKQIKSTTRSQTMISDIYERIPRFLILCRINHINHFTSKKGHPCTKLMLIDEKGDEIMCLPYDKSAEGQNNKTSLLKGRAYLFENGSVEQDSHGCLSISIPMSSIQDTKTVLQSFQPAKMKRVADLQIKEPSQAFENAFSGSARSVSQKRVYSRQINVCGILKGYFQDPKLTNNQFRVVATLCDPDHEVSINFVLFLDEISTFPMPGAVISLHNMHVCEYERTQKLEQSKRSYYLIQNNNTHRYFADLVQMSKKETWKRKDYKNLSEVRYIRRTIAELKQLLSRLLQNDQCHSEIDCNIANLRQRKQFPACVTCHHEMKSDRSVRTYCYHCKKIENIETRFVFVCQVADSTGSIDLTVYSQEISPFINMSVQEYARLPQDARNEILELSTFQNIFLRVRSQQLVGGPSHVGVRAEKSSHTQGLTQIKEKSIEAKTAYMPVWL